MKYTAYTEAQIQGMNVMPDGIYIFQVLEVITTDKYNNQLQDKNGIDMAKLKLLVWDSENKERTIFTFLSGDGNFAYKLRHFAKSIGQVLEYEAGTFDIDNTVGMSGKASIVIKRGTIKTDGSGEMWADRNDVKDFITSDTQGTANLALPKGLTGAQTRSNADQSLGSDDIPF